MRKISRIGKFGILCIAWYASFACNTKTIEYDTIPLHHELGELQIRKWTFFDTLFQWTHTLDCDCCHLRKARLGNSKFPLILENSWKYPQPDSVLQLTVTQTEKASCDTAFTVNFREMRAQQEYISNLYGFSTPYWVYNQFKVVDGHDFIVLGWEIPEYGRYNNQNLQRLLAITSIDGRKVTLDFDCRKQDCGNFLKRSFWLLKEMKIGR